jgi:hypothetical protein
MLKQHSIYNCHFLKPAAVPRLNFGCDAPFSNRNTIAQGYSIRYGLSDKPLLFCMTSYKTGTTICDPFGVGRCFVMEVFVNMGCRWHHIISSQLITAITLIMTITVFYHYSYSSGCILYNYTKTIKGTKSQRDGMFIAMGEAGRSGTPKGSYVYSSLRVLQNIVRNTISSYNVWINHRHHNPHNCCRNFRNCCHSYYHNQLHRHRYADDGQYK